MQTISLQLTGAPHAQQLDVALAGTPFARMRGLLGRPPLRRGQALMLRPCNLIHTVGMGYAIDVVFLRRDGLVLHVAPDVPPLRMRGHWRAHSVLELAAGEAARCAIRPGMVLPLEALR
jgi:uncharacterized membrane protein (UPF0127 family)